MRRVQLGAVRLTLTRGRFAPSAAGLAAGAASSDVVLKAYVAIGVRHGVGHLVDGLRVDVA